MCFLKDVWWDRTKFVPYRGLVGHDVGYVAVVSCETDCFKDFVIEKASGTSNERLAASVFVLAGCFSNNEYACITFIKMSFGNRTVREMRAYIAYKLFVRRPIHSLR